MHMTTIRLATANDARELATLAERTFRDTFAAANTAEDMELHVQASYSESMQAGEIANPHMMTLLCDAERSLIGFAQLRWQEAPSCVRAESPAEIQRLYVDGAWHGQGIAPMLMRACLDAMHARGCDVAWLGVWERNPRAIAFYRKFGFVEVGDHTFTVGRDAQRDIIMARPVVAPDVLVP